MAANSVGLCCSSHAYRAGVEWPKRSFGFRCISPRTELKVRSAARQVSATGQSQARSRWAWANSASPAGRWRLSSHRRRLATAAALLGSPLSRRSSSSSPGGWPCCSSLSCVANRRLSGSLEPLGSRSSWARSKAPSSWRGLRSTSSSSRTSPGPKRSGSGQRQAVSKRSPWRMVAPLMRHSAASAHQRRARRTVSASPRRPQASGQLS